MAQLIPETLNWREYERSTEAQVKVRSAAIFLDELLEEFKPRSADERYPEMFSTKLRRKLEFRPGEVTLWAGYSKHRKSMFAGQVALDLCCQKQKVLSASFEMLPQKTLGRMAKQAFGVAVPSNAELEHFSNWTDGKLWLFDHFGRINPNQCIAVCEYFASELGGQHIFIDSMMMVVASEKDIDEQKQFGTDLVRLAQEAGIHVHLVAHCRKPENGDESKPPTKHSIRGSAAIADQVSNIITVWANKDKKRRLEKDPGDLGALSEPDAVISVEGQRHSSYEGKLQLWFDDASMRFMDDRTNYVEPYIMEGVTA